MTECISFLDQWNEDPHAIKPVFERFKSFLEGRGGLKMEFKARPGVSYSLRGLCSGSERDVFALVDVVDDDPGQRWLSVCFYDDMVSDPQELGDWVPEGLGGKDARCFDLSKNDSDLVDYVENRIDEAWSASLAL